MFQFCVCYNFCIYAPCIYQYLHQFVKKLFVIIQIFAFFFLPPGKLFVCFVTVMVIKKQFLLSTITTARRSKQSEANVSLLLQFIDQKVERFSFCAPAHPSTGPHSLTHNGCVPKQHQQESFGKKSTQHNWDSSEVITSLPRVTCFRLE